MIYIALKSGDNVAEITKRGQVVVAPLDFSTFYSAQTAANNVPVNVTIPNTRKSFIMTDIVLAGDRSIGASGAVTKIYENSVGPTDTAITKLIYEDEIAKQTRAILTGLNIIVTEGVWINVVSDDVIVRCNIGGYFIDTL